MRFPTPIETSLRGSFLPEDVFPSEGFLAQLFSLDDVDVREPISVRVWRLHPLGFEFFLPAELDNRVHPGIRVRYSLYLGSEAARFDGLITEAQSNESGETLVSVRAFFVDSPSIPAERARRRFPRWNCHDLFLPTCVWKNPGRMNDFVFCRVRDISCNGARLITSMRNKFLTTGMKIEALINFPLVGQARARFVAVNVSVVAEMGREYLTIGVEFDGVNKAVRELMFEYLSQFASSTVVSAFAAGNSAFPDASKEIVYSYVRTEHEYREVLALRKVARKNRTEDEELVAETLGSAFDCRARILNDSGSSPGSAGVAVEV